MFIILLNKLAEMKNELVMVKAQKDSFARRLRHLLESQLDLIHVLELDDLGFGKYETKQTRNPAMSKVDHETKSGKIEFKAIDDSYIKPNSNEESKIYKEKPAENTSGLHRNKPEISKEQSDMSEQEKRKTKISDQLLF